MFDINDLTDEKYRDICFVINLELKEKEKEINKLSNNINYESVLFMCRKLKSYKIVSNLKDIYLLYKYYESRYNNNKLIEFDDKVKFELLFKYLTSLSYYDCNYDNVCKLLFIEDYYIWWKYITDEDFKNFDFIKELSNSTKMYEYFKLWFNNDTYKYFYKYPKLLDNIFSTIIMVYNSSELEWREMVTYIWNIVNKHRISLKIKYIIIDNFYNFSDIWFCKKMDSYVLGLHMIHKFPKHCHCYIKRKYLKDKAYIETLIEYEDVIGNFKNKEKLYMEYRNNIIAIKLLEKI